MQKITISLPDPVAHQFFAKIPKGKRSQFMTQALKKELEQEAKLNAIQAIRDFIPLKSDIDAVETLRDIREGREEELISNISCIK